MPGRTCAQCGSPLPDEAKFCGQCGALTDTGPRTDPAPPPSSSTTVHGAPAWVAPAPAPAAAPPPLQGRNVQKTVMEFAAAPIGTPPPTAARGSALSGTAVMGGAPPAAPPQPAAAQARPGETKKTMIGIAATEMLAPPRPVAPQPQAAAPASGDKRTMMGVAMPGIAPLHAGNPNAPPPAPTAAGSDKRTIAGVAMPGIAPLHASAPATPGAPVAGAAWGARPAAPPVDIVPPPPPLQEIEPAPAAPVIVKRRGVPVAIVAVLVGLLLVAGAIVLLIVWRSTPPLTAQPRLDDAGKEVLRLACEACKDGTTAELNGARATFKSGEADLPLTVPLKVGDNPLTIALDRPGMGRDETVKLVVPVAFRIRADLSTLVPPHPAITVRVEAVPGTDVRVDGKPLALDAQGNGAYAVDLTQETEGPSDETAVINKSIAYVVTPKNGQPEKGSVAARVSIVPLRVDTPGAHAVLATSTFILSGRAPKGSTVMVNGSPATVSADGHFETSMDAAMGTTNVEVSAASPSFAPRTVHLAVRRVEDLAAEAKAFEAQNPVGYDAALADIANKTGAPMIVEGEVIESRVLGRRTVLLVNDTRGCAKTPCVARVVVTHEEKIANGDTVRAYGRIQRATTAGDKTVPDVEADFVLKGPGRRAGW